MVHEADGGRGRSGSERSGVERPGVERPGVERPGAGRPGAGRGGTEGLDPEHLDPERLDPEHLEPEHLRRGHLRREHGRPEPLRSERLGPERLGPDPRESLRDLSAGQRLAVLVAAGAVAVGLLVHTGATFLHLAPRNAATDAIGDTVNAYMAPEFSQSWQLFAPDITRTMTAVAARVELREADGTTRTGPWRDLTARDLAELRGNPLPSRIRQQLATAWTRMLATHDPQQRPIGLAGLDSEQYLKRLALSRMPATPPGARVERIQFRSTDTTVPPPPWKTHAPRTAPVVRVHPWWPVGAADFAEGRTS
ncbi:DUF5819 family protein [Streptomyces sp. NPDC051597]|uniref:DUF5819 family protein n=1 Tax=Streptomyces sp. NPDC051597 TaxID=3155049 RepID=UPI00343E0FA9